jgi:outer membrane protein X
MKKILFTIIITCLAIFAQAQKKNSFKPFKVDLAIGYAIPGGSGSKGGVVLALEPKYALNDNLTLGLRLETALTARGAVDASGMEVTGDIKGMGSYFATADYFFNTHKFRPFVGAGLGVVNIAAASFDTQSSQIDAEDVQASTNFGFMPRVGFELGHFRTGLEYNIMGKTGDINNNYLGIKLGFFFGGGRLK